MLSDFQNRILVLLKNDDSEVEEEEEGKLISRLSPLGLNRSIVVVDMTTGLFIAFRLEHQHSVNSLLLTEAIARFSSSFANYPLIAG